MESIQLIPGEGTAGARPSRRRVQSTTFVLRTLLGIWFFTWVPAAMAQTGDIANWWNNPAGLTGEWGGERSALKNSGVDIYGGFVGEGADNESGGRATGSAFASQTNVGVTLDLQKIADIPGLKIHLEVVNRTGRNLSGEDVGNLFEVQEIFGGGTRTRLAEASVEMAFRDDAINIKVGRIFAGADFGFSPLYCNFQTNAICGHPNSLPYNTGMSLYPVATWGGRIQVKPTDDTYLRTGVFEVNPSLNAENGFDWSTRNSTGAFIPVEVAYLYGGDRMPGSYKLGAYYDTSSTPDNYFDQRGGSAILDGLAVRSDNGRYGAYILVDQKVFKDPRSDLGGLTVFAGATVSDRNTAYFRTFSEAGLLYQGLFDGRAKDTLGLAAAYGRVASGRADAENDQNILAPRSVGVQSYEAVLEVSYGLQLNPWLRLLPNFQYVIRPGGTGEFGNAKVIGLRTAIQF